MHEKMLTYGLKRGTKDDLRHIDSVPNGLVCDCVCPHCQHDLIARNGGTKKTHHFAHASGADCGGARMTALHILAQKILERDKVVMLPVFETEYVKHDAQQKEFANVVLEQVWKDDTSTRKPDCVCSQEDSRNPLVMFVFEKLNLAEQRGLGFGTIRQLPRNQRPIVTFEDPYIVFTLPLTKNTRNNTIAPNDISMFLEEHPTFTRAQFATFFALSDKSAVRLINKMISEGIISASGEKRGIKYAKI